MVLDLHRFLCLFLLSQEAMRAFDSKWRLCLAIVVLENHILDFVSGNILRVWFVHYVSIPFIMSFMRYLLWTFLKVFVEKGGDSLLKIPVIVFKNAKNNDKIFNRRYLAELVYFLNLFWMKWIEIHVFAFKYSIIRLELDLSSLNLYK